MTTNDTFEHIHNQWMDKYQDAPEFIAEEMAIDITEEASRILAERGLKHSWLAEVMNVSRQRVSTIFSGPPNLTLLSIAQIGKALRVKPKVILDSERYIIRSVNDTSLDHEDRMTEAKIQQAQSTQGEYSGGTSTLDSTIDDSAGASRYGNT